MKLVMPPCRQGVRTVHCMNNIFEGESAEEKGYQTISFDLPGHGERADENERCDIWNGVRDLAIVRDYVLANWKEISLYACSLGVYFRYGIFDKTNDDVVTTKCIGHCKR